MTKKKIIVIIWSLLLLGCKDKSSFKKNTISSNIVKIENKNNSNNNPSNENDIINLLKAHYKIVEKMKCDLNKDNLNDVILVFQPLKTYTQKDSISLDSPVYVLINNGKNKFKVYQNKNIIYSFMPNSPAEGFTNLIIKENFFTIEQQKGGGWLFIDTYTTFKYDKKSQEIMLSKYGKSFTDRRDPDKEIPDEIYTVKNFEKINFEDYNSNSILNKVR